MILKRFQIVASAVAFSAGVASSAVNATPVAADYLRMAAAVESNLRQHILGHWYPASVDTEKGGFFQDFTEDWTRSPRGTKGVVCQSRLTWTAAAFAMHAPAEAETYLAHARHGLKFLSDHQWDAKHGGFFWGIGPTGKPPTPTDAQRLAYGSAFGMYAAATTYKATQDPAALELAKKAFLWFDGQSHDAKNGGYLEVAVTSDETPPPPGEPATNPIGAKADEKSMNSSIHILEALTALYGVWPDPVVKSRLNEMFEITRDKIYADPGYLRLYFTVDWKPRVTEDSYGHDVETAFLLVEAATALGMPEDAKTWRAARNLIDHALKVGADPVTGALYDSGPVDGIETGGPEAVAYKKEKIWWVEAEWLNALLLMHEKFGAETPIYWDAFVKEWDWISNHQVDAVHGGWLKTVNADGSNPHEIKGDGWTECYHQGRAMMEVSERLKKLAGQ